MSHKGADIIQLTTSDSDNARSFPAIHAANSRWTYELPPAHWRDNVAVRDRDLGGVSRGVARLKSIFVQLSVPTIALTGLLVTEA